MYLANFFFEFLLFEVLDFDDQIVLLCCFYFLRIQNRLFFEIIVKNA